MTPQTQPSQRAPDESDHERQCRLTITKSLAQRTSTKAPWFRAIGPQNADSATAGLMNCQNVVPRDILRVLDLPPNLSWAKVATFLRSSLPTTQQSP